MNTASTLDQTDVASNRVKGDQYFGEGKLNRAIRAYRRALEHSPHDAELTYMYAECCGRKGWHIVARALYCKAFRYDAEQVRRLQSELAAADGNAVDTDGSLKSIFVLGCPHSGTTIMTRLLAHHPQLMHAHLAESQLCSKHADQIKETLRQWDARCEALGKAGWVEKSVSHSFQVPRLLHHRPRAKFIIVLRDGRDVTTSMRARWYAHRNFAELVNLWLYINRTILHYQDDERFHVVRYEDLVTDPEPTLIDLCHAVGIDYAASILDYHQNEISWNGRTRSQLTHRIGGHEDHEKLRHWQINQPLFDGRGRWELEMTEEDKKIFKSIAGMELKKMGYASSCVW